MGPPSGMGVPAPTWRQHFWTQMTMLILLNFSQGVMLTMPFTLSVYMVRHFLEEQQGPGTAIDEQVVGRQTGMLAASFSFAQFTTSMLWGVLSNIIGRKTVAAFGTFVTGVAMIWYGMCTSYSAALLSRIVAGLLNGVLGAWKCIIGESGDSLTQGKMFGYMSLAWGIGSTAGPLIGGYLSRPCMHNPDFPLCAPGQLFAVRPFSLPCLVGGIFILLCSFATMLFLIETLPDSLRQQQLSSLSDKYDWLMARLGRPAASATHTAVPTCELCCTTPSPDGRHTTAPACALNAVNPKASHISLCSTTDQSGDNVCVDVPDRRIVMVKPLVSSESCPEGCVEGSGRQETESGALHVQHHVRPHVTAEDQVLLAADSRPVCRSISLTDLLVQANPIHGNDEVLDSSSNKQGVAHRSCSAEVPVSVLVIDEHFRDAGSKQAQQQADRMCIEISNLPDEPTSAPPRSSPAALPPLPAADASGQWQAQCGCEEQNCQPRQQQGDVRGMHEGSSGAHQLLGGMQSDGSYSAGTGGGGVAAEQRHRFVRWADEQELQLHPLMSCDSIRSTTSGPRSTDLSHLSHASPASRSLQHVDSIRARMGHLMRAGSRVFVRSNWTPYTRQHGQFDDGHPLLQRNWSRSERPGSLGGGAGSGSGSEKVLRGVGAAGGGQVKPDTGSEREPLLTTPQPLSSAEPLLPWHKNPQVVLTIAAYALMAFLYCAMDELLPLFASAPVEQGGLGLTEHQLAPAITLFGVTLMIYSAWIYPALQKTVGTLRLARWGLLTAVGTCVFIPFAHTLSAWGPTWAHVVLYASMIIKSISQCNAFTGALVMVNAAPHKSQLGSVNGVGQTLAALVRGLGPAMGGILWSLTLTLKTPGQQYLPFVIVSLLAVSSFLVYGHVYLPNLK